MSEQNNQQIVQLQQAVLQAKATAFDYQQHSEQQQLQLQQAGTFINEVAKRLQVIATDGKVKLEDILSKIDELTALAPANGN